MTISTQSKAIRVQTGDARGREIKAANPLRAGRGPAGRKQSLEDGLSSPSMKSNRPHA